MYSVALAAGEGRSECQAAAPLISLGFCEKLRRLKKARLQKYVELTFQNEAVALRGFPTQHWRKYTLKNRIVFDSCQLTNLSHCVLLRFSLISRCGFHLTFGQISGAFVRHPLRRLRRLGVHAQTPLRSLRSLTFDRQPPIKTNLSVPQNGTDIFIFCFQ